MEAPDHKPVSFSILDWTIDPGRLSIQKAGAGEVRIRRRSMAVLVTLAAARGQVVRKNDLLDAVWPRSDVTDGVLSQAMLELRTAFADDSKNPSVFETIRGVGFRLIPPVRMQGLEAVVVRHPAAREPVPATARATSSIQNHWIIGIVAVLVLAVAAAYSIGRFGLFSQAEAPLVMVAPFESIGAGPDEEYFARGIAEDIGMRLGAQGQVRLLSGQALRFFLAAGEKPMDVAARFDVDLILTGSVRRQEGSLRLVAELSDVRTGEQRWIETYERSLDEVFDVQDDVATTVTRILVGRGTSHTNLARTGNLTAYDFYLRGREFIGLHRDDANEQSISLFSAALDLDPQFDAARASLAEALAYRGYVWQHGDSALTEALAEADRALAHRADLAQAHYARMTALTGLGRMLEAGEAGRRAIAASPNYSDAEFGLGYLANVRGDLKEAYLHFARAIELDPSQPRTVAIAVLMALAGLQDDALELARRGDLLAPGIPTVYLAHFRTLLGHNAEARVNCERVLQTPVPNALNLCGFGALVAGDLATAERLLREDWEHDPRARSGPFTFAASATYLAWIMLQRGEREEANVLLAESERRTDVLLSKEHEHWAPSYNQAAVAMLLGDATVALDQLEVAFAKGMRNYRLLEIDPIFEPLRADPRFIALPQSMRRAFEDLGRVLAEERAQRAN